MTLVGVPVLDNDGAERLLACHDIGGYLYPAHKSGFGDASSITPVDATNPMPTRPVPHISNGLTPHYLISLGTTNATVVEDSATKVYKGKIYNDNAAVRYLKIYDLAVTPVPGTHTPKHVYPLKPDDYTDIEWGDIGLELATGFAYILTVNQAITDNTGVAAGDITVNFDYKA